MTLRGLGFPWSATQTSTRLSHGGCVSSRPDLPADVLQSSSEERPPLCCSQVQLGFRYESRDQRFTIYVTQLANCSALCLPADQKMYVPPFLFVTPCNGAPYINRRETLLPVNFFISFLSLYKNEPKLLNKYHLVTTVRALASYGSIKTMKL